MLTLTLKLLIWSSFISIYIVNKTTLAQPSVLWRYCNGTCNCRLEHVITGSPAVIIGSRPHLIASPPVNTYNGYETELNKSLSTLPNTNSGIGFFNSSDGIVKSVALCRGDVNTDVCQSCLNDAIFDLQRYCADRTQAIGFYDSCLLKYSDQQINLLKTDPETILVVPNSSYISNDVNQFNDALKTLLANLSQKAADGSSELKYAKGQMASRPGLLTDALVQCDPDLSDSECSSCLIDSIDNNIMNLNGNMSGRFLKPMCNIRFDTDYVMIPSPSPSPVLLPSLAPLFQQQSPPPGKKTEKIKKWTWISVVVVIPLILLICLGILWYIKKRKHRREEYERRKRDEYFLELTARSFKDVHQLETDGGKGNDLLLFSFASIMTATNDFSVENKLGQGGFGPVYKGKLSDGREIAIKRLSRTSGQGLVEFKNELILIAKLQHTNLVRVLGCCIHKEERMLVYEYMPNKSLDFFLFDENRKVELDWPKRFNIIEGIAQGLLYLHKYSRMRVIHRDLKVSNILLDENLNPKISDFGMARIFNKNETEAMTDRVVGTYGYMSPEYAMEGTFSIKSDIFSFGVLILEIISGRKNSSFIYLDQTFNLIGYAWELWQQEDTLELKDPTLGNTCVVQQFLRVVHIALLCVQESAADRPTTSDMISMLLNDTMSLPTPNRPAFVIGKVESEPTLEGKVKDCSVNDMTITVMEGR